MIYITHEHGIHKHPMLLEFFLIILFSFHVFQIFPGIAHVLDDEYDTFCEKYKKRMKKNFPTQFSIKYYV